MPAHLLPCSALLPIQHLIPTVSLLSCSAKHLFEEKKTEMDQVLNEMGELSDELMRVAEERGKAEQVRDAVRGKLDALAREKKDLLGTKEATTQQLAAHKEAAEQVRVVRMHGVSHMGVGTG